MPAHSDSDVGIRLGIGARLGASPMLVEPPRSVPSTPSISPRTLSCTSGTGFGRPVVPEVNEMAATPAGGRGAARGTAGGAGPGPAAGGGPPRAAGAPAPSSWPGVDRPGP